jgi:probable HAF family extracellular repeat protein
MVFGDSSMDRRGWTVKSRRFRSFYPPLLLLMLLWPAALPSARANQPAVAEPRYLITALPGLPGRPFVGSQAYEINERGQIVGSIRFSETSSAAVLWENGTVVDLGSFGGSRSAARSIAEDGRIVGSSDLPAGADGISISHAFLWTNGTLTDLGTLPGTANSSATAINAAGDIIGVSFDPQEPAIGVVWQDGIILELGGVDPRLFWPITIEDTGVIVGAVGMVGGDPTATIWRNGVFTLLPEPDAAISMARDMNDGGVVVGMVFMAAGQQSHATMWVDGVMVDLGIPENFWHSDAFAVNNLGQVVGVGRPRGSANDVPQEPHGMLWWNGEVIDLTEALVNGDGWVLELVMDINDQGQIVGIGRFNGQQRAFLLTPIKT